LAIEILSIPQLGTQVISESLEWLFMSLIPNFCLGEGVSDFYSNYMYLNICKPYLPLCPLVCSSHQINISCCKGI